MRVRIFCESTTDAAALSVLVEALLGGMGEIVELPLMARESGYTSVLRSLPTVIRGTYYGQHAEALVVALDSDESPVHVAAHESPGQSDPGCRLCRLRQTAAEVQRGMDLIPGRPLIRVAVGMAVPAIEAWYQSVDDARVSEVAWLHALRDRRFPYDRLSLKRAVYGSERNPDREKALHSSRRLAEDLARLEEAFPSGFGSMAREIRSWVAGEQDED